MGQAYGDRPAEDLTARARIVDAALALFADRGPSATLKAIADAAGVSVGLVQHHFGTKDKLREACDERVLALVRLKVDEVHPGGRITQPEFIGTLYDAAVPVMPYVARVALEADERAASLFDEVMHLTALFLTSQWPERFPEGADRTRDAAAVHLAMGLGTLALHHQLARLMGLDDAGPIPSAPVGLAMLDVYQAMGDLLASPLGEQLREAVDTYYERRKT